MFGIMTNKIIVSNVRMPEDEWLQAKAAAREMKMSMNEYFRYLTRVDSARSITGIKKRRPSKNPYKALEKLRGLVSRSKGKPMGASEEDKIIYGIED